MGMIFTQTDSGGGCPAAAFCSGHAIAPTTYKTTANIGGTPGTATHIPFLNLLTTRATVFFNCSPAQVEWAGGVYTVRLEVAVANNNIFWPETWLCRASILCANIVTVGSLTGQSTRFTAASVYTHAITGAAQIASKTDVFMVVIVLRNRSALPPGQFVNIKASQNIDTPIVSLIARRPRPGPAMQPMLNY